MAILTKDEFEETVRRRVASHLALRDLGLALAAARQRRDALALEVKRTAENVRLYEASEDIHLPEAKKEAAAAAKRWEEEGEALSTAIEGKDLEEQEHRETIRQADIDIETTKEVMATFGQEG